MLILGGVDQGTVVPRYNPAVGVHKIEPRYTVYSAGAPPPPITPQKQPKPMCWLHGLCVIYKTN